MNHIELRSPSLTIGENDIAKESLTISQTLCSENRLTFGECSAGTFKLRIRYDKPLSTKEEFELAITGDTTITWEHLRVHIDNPTADRCYRDVTLVDRMYTILNKTVTFWYNQLWENRPLMTLKEFRSAFFVHCGVPEVFVKLPNDDMTIGKTIDAEEIKGRTIVQAICQINGCFGKVNEFGEFDYVFLQKMGEGLYPSKGLYPHKGLYPRGGTNAAPILPGSYISADYEDFKTEVIEKVQIRQDPDDVGGIAGTGENCYIIEDNFLCYGQQGNVLQRIAQNILDKVQGLWYTPATINAVGDLSLHVGDGVRIETGNRTVYTYILQRKLKGIQAMKDTYSAKGTKTFLDKVATVNEDIIRLSGKTNRLTRTVEELTITIEDEKDGLQSQIRQNADAIRAVVAYSYTGNFVTEAMLGDRIVRDPDLGVSGFGVECGGWDGPIVLGPFRMNAGVEYELNFIAQSDDVGITYVIPEAYLLDNNKQEIEQLDIFPSRVRAGGSTHTATIIPISNADYYIRVGCPDAQMMIHDIMLAQGIAPIEWTPNRVDEYAQLNMTSQKVEAKVEKTGGDASSFAWELLADRFELKSNNRTVFKCDDTGIQVDGFAQIDYVDAEIARVSKLKAEEIVADKLQAVYADIETLTSSVATLGEVVSKKATIDDLKTTNITVQTLSGTVANLGEAVADKATIEDLKTTNTTVETLSGTVAILSEVVAKKATIDDLKTTNANVKTLSGNVATISQVVASKIDASYITAGVISSLFQDPRAGMLTLGTVRSASFQYYDGSSYKALSGIAIKIGTTNYRVMGYRV